MEPQVNKLDIDGYLKLPVKDRPAALKDGRFSVPSRKLDPEARAKWDKFANVEPESAVEKPAEEVKKVEQKPVEKQAPVEEKKPEAPKEPEKKSLFKSLEEAESEFLKREELLKQNKEVTEASRREFEADKARYEAEKAKLLKELEEERKKATPKAEEVDFEVLEVPEAPDPFDKEKYPEGAFDEAFIKADHDYRIGFNKWAKANAIGQKKTKEALKENSRLKSKIEDLDKFRSESVTRETRKVNEEIESETDKTVSQIQKDLGLTMGTDWKRLNSDYRVFQGKDSTPEAKASAEARLKLISASDKEAFAKLAQAATLILDHTGKPRYKLNSNMYKATLLDGGFKLVEKTEEKPKVDLEKPQPDKGVSGIAPDVIGAEDNFSELSRDEKEEKFNDIGKKYDEEYRRTGNRKEKNSFYKERMALKKELGY